MKFLLRSLLPALFVLPAVAAPEAGSPPKPKRIVLVHGFMDTGKKFKALQKRLEKRGVECLSPTLRNPDGRGGLDLLAAGLKQDIDRRFGSGAKISIVAFSMGGLVSRYYLQELGGAGRCDNFITVSSPHNGTLAAYLYPTKGAEQMRPNSAFLSSLRQSQDKLGKMPVVSYRTPMDLIIVPAQSSVWDRAENLQYPIILHPLMVTSDSVLSDIERRLLD